MIVMTIIRIPTLFFFGVGVLEQEPPIAVCLLARSMLHQIQLELQLQQDPVSEYDNDKGICEEMERTALHSWAISMRVQAELTGITTKWKDDELKDDLLGEWLEVLELVRAELVHIF
jgi:hypothetical protein